MEAALPTGRNGQILAAGRAVLAVVAAWLAVVSPVLDWYGARAAQLETLRLRVARETALIEMLPELKKQSAAASKTPVRAVLTGDTDAIAGAALQEEVQSMANTANAQLTSIETLPGEQKNAYRRIGVRVELSAQLPVVVALLKAVEEAQPSLVVDDIRLTGTPTGPMNVQLPLDAAFTVYGFRLGTAKDEGQ
jgi:type II secretory pathway component PulM